MPIQHYMLPKKAGEIKWFFIDGSNDGILPIEDNVEDEVDGELPIEGNFVIDVNESVFSHSSETSSLDISLHRDSIHSTLSLEVYGHGKETQMNNLEVIQPHGRE